MNGLVIALIKLIFVVVVVILLIVLSVRIECSLVFEVMGHYFNMVFECHFALVDVDQVVGKAVHLQKLRNVLALFHDRHAWRRPNHSHFVEAEIFVLGRLEKVHGVFDKFA